jgi:hypothetical protein
MPTLLEYINQLQREHRYRIKMVFQPSESQLETVERHMKKYDALEVGRPEKLMLQAQPMDFPHHAGHEIVIMDVVTRLPVSMPTLESELRTLLFASEGALKVFGRDEPVEQQMEAEAKEPAEAITGTEYTSAEANAVSADESFGDKYTQNLLKDLGNARADAKENIVKAEAKSEAKESQPDFEVKNSPSPLSSVKNPKVQAKGTK